MSTFIEGKVAECQEVYSLKSLLKNLKAIQPDTWELKNYEPSRQVLSSTTDTQLTYTFEKNSTLRIHLPNGDTTTVSIDNKTLEQNKPYYHAVFDFFQDLVTEIINKTTKK